MIDLKNIGLFDIIGAKLPRGERRSGGSQNRRTEGDSVQWENRDGSRGFSNNFGGFVGSGINDYLFSNRNMSVAELIEVELNVFQTLNLKKMSSCFCLVFGQTILSDTSFLRKPQVVIFKLLTFREKYKNSTFNLITLYS